MHDYDVIVRIPIRATDTRDAYVKAQEIENDIQGCGYEDAYMDTPECTGPVEE